MKVSFEATFEDFVEVSIRTIKNSKEYNSAQKNVRILASIFVGIIIFVLVPSTVLGRLIWGVFGSFLMVLIYPYFYQRSFEKRIRNYCREQMGTQNSFLVEVELNAQGFTCKQLQTQITYDWSAVQDIQVTPDGVDFIIQNGGITTVRAKAFESPEQQEEFVELANNYRNAN
ncbi:MAG: hypothetical protein PVJ21_17395 [Anaerolineales bacterium]|jgi:hypothetical protein